MLVDVPGKPQPLSLIGKVSHTILAQDDEPPGMGVGARSFKTLARRSGVLEGHGRDPK